MVACIGGNELDNMCCRVFIKRDGSALIAR